MPGVVRTGIDVGDGGSSCSPCPYGQGSPNVFVNDANIIRIGDPLTCGGGAAAGSPDVFANNIKIHRLGDKTECNGEARSSSTNVIAN